MEEGESGTTEEQDAMSSVSSTQSSSSERTTLEEMESETTTKASTTPSGNTRSPDTQEGISLLEFLNHLLDWLIDITSTEGSTASSSID